MSYHKISESFDGARSGVKCLYRISSIATGMPAKCQSNEKTLITDLLPLGLCEILPYGILCDAESLRAIYSLDFPFDNIFIVKSHRLTNKNSLNTWNIHNISCWYCTLSMRKNILKVTQNCCSHFWNNIYSSPSYQCITLDNFTNST